MLFRKSFKIFKGLFLFQEFSNRLIDAMKTDFWFEPYIDALAG